MGKNRESVGYVYFKKKNPKIRLKINTQTLYKAGSFT